MVTEKAPALKDWFDEGRFHQISSLLSEIHPEFDRKAFLASALPGLDDLGLLQRLRRMTTSTRCALPCGYEESLAVLRELAPRIEHKFVTLFLPDFVGLYGLDQFEESMAALKDFTRFGTSEFAIREFLRRDLHRTLEVMRDWSHDEDEHVRRLASEGSRPRLPWSFRLENLVSDPSPTLAILENLKSDPSLYVRKSVANHLNDISKDNPETVVQLLRDWGGASVHTVWIAKRALRTLVKSGDREALALIGAGEKAEVRVVNFGVAPPTIQLGEALRLSAKLASKARKDQRLVDDYAIHYVKKSGGSSAKVFKWKETDLPSGATLDLRKSQAIRNFTTRVHYPGCHRVELLVNGEKIAEATFLLAE